jgi:hypothetical protein
MNPDRTWKMAGRSSKIAHVPGVAIDVFDYIDLCREHYERVGIGADYVDGLFR